MTHQKGVATGILLFLLFSLIVPSGLGVIIVADNARFTGATYNEDVTVTGSVNVTFDGATFNGTVLVNDSTAITFNHSTFLYNLSSVVSSDVNASLNYWNTSYAPRGGMDGCNDGFPFISS